MSSLKNKRRSDASRSSASFDPRRKPGQSTHSLSPGVYTKGWADRSNCARRRSKSASVHGSGSPRKSPTCTTKSSRSRPIASIIATNFASSRALYGTSPITAKAKRSAGGGPAAHCTRTSAAAASANLRVIGDALQPIKSLERLLGRERVGLDRVERGGERGLRRGGSRLRRLGGEEVRMG